MKLIKLVKDILGEIKDRAGNFITNYTCRKHQYIIAYERIQIWRIPTAFNNIVRQSVDHYKVYTCVKCGHSYDDTERRADNHNIVVMEDNND